MTPNRFLFLAAACFLAWHNRIVAAEPVANPQPRTQFLQDQPWPDDKGTHINAHGGSIMYRSGKYYWFGELYPDKKNPAPQVAPWPSSTILSNDVFRDELFDQVPLGVSYVHP